MMWIADQSRTPAIHVAIATGEMPEVWAEIEIEVEPPEVEPAKIEASSASVIPRKRGCGVKRSELEEIRARMIERRRKGFR